LGERVALRAETFASSDEARAEGMRGQSIAATYQIYALKYGERETKEGQFFFREASQKPLTLHFFVWVILGGPYPFVVDTGCTEPDAKL
jgi:hypothetical protein